MSENKLLVVIAGPTAVGKTDLCVQLAQRFDTEVVSADSRQFYQELSIGTAKPSIAEMQGVRHHFVGSMSIHDYFSVGDYEQECLGVLEGVFRDKSIAILTGGSGLFLKVVIDGIDDMPDAPLEIREKLTKQYESEGIESLLGLLQSLDLAYYQEVDKQNPQRVIRALEVCIDTGKPFSSFRNQTKVKRPFDILKIALDRPRDELYARIDTRVDVMLKAGLVEEALQYIDFREHYALRTVGYKEIFEWKDGLYDYSEMVRLIKRNTRRYAKRQLTWFRNQDDFRWFNPADFESIEDTIQQKIREIL